MSKNKASLTDIVKMMQVDLKDNYGVKLSQKELSYVFNSLKNSVAGLLKEGKRVKLQGIVTFTPTLHPSRRSHNVATGEITTLPERVVVSTKAGKLIREVGLNIKEE